MRNEMDAFGGIGCRPRRTIPRAMCATSASGCSAVTRTLDSRTRSDCLEIDRDFTTRRFAERDDADFIVSLRMNDGNGHADQQAECHKPLLRIVESVVLEGVCDAGEHVGSVPEVEAMIFQIAPSLRFRSTCSAWA